jgi:RecA-family ATPase
MLAGRPLIILEDNDESGRHNTEKALAVLTPVASSIKVVRLPGLRHREDVVNWLDAGHTREEFDAVVEATDQEGLTAEIDVTILDQGPLPPQQWVVDQRIPLEVAGLISGHGGTGKSTIMLQGSVACVLGQPWLGLPVRQGPTLYIDAEDPKLAILHRINAIRHHYGSVSGDELKQLGLHIHSLRGRNAVLGELGRSGRIAPTENYHRLIELVAAIKPVLITIANSANTFAGSEIDRSQVQQFMDMLTHAAMVAGGTLMLIAHSSLTGMTTKTGLSGSTQWHNGSRARMTLSGTKRDEEEPSGDLRMLEFHKNQYGPDGRAIAVRYQNGVFVPVAGVTVSIAERNQQVDDLYLDLLTELTIRQDLASSRHATNYAAKLIFNHPRGREFIGQEEVEAAQTRLLSASKIHIGESRSGPKSKRFQAILPGEGPL